MIFPEAKRYKYTNNPLIDVIAQLRFSPITSINKSLDSTFQDILRKNYLDYKESISQQLFSFQIGNNPVIPNSISPVQPLPPAQPDIIKNYKMSDKEKNWTLTIEQSFLALTTKKYTVWEDFSSRLHNASITFEDSYAPLLYTRVGLRYINIFCRSKMGVPIDTPWTDLLRPEILGLIAAEEEISKSVGHAESVHEISSNEKDKIKIMTAKVQDINSDEECIKLDCDYFATCREDDMALVFETLNRLHDLSTRFFNWAVLDAAKTAMGKEEL